MKHDRPIVNHLVVGGAGTGPVQIGPEGHQNRIAVIHAVVLSLLVAGGVGDGRRIVLIRRPA